MIYTLNTKSGYVKQPKKVTSANLCSLLVAFVVLSKKSFIDLLRVTLLLKFVGVLCIVCPVLLEENSEV